MGVEECLPPGLRGLATTLTRMPQGLSPAAVYLVETPDDSLVLKIADPSTPLVDWTRQLAIQQAAAGAGLAPPITHVDESRRAILSAFIADRSFPAFFAHPQTHQAAIDLLGRTLRRLHEIPAPPQATAVSAEAFLRTSWTKLEATTVIPTFVHDAVERVLAHEAPDSLRPLVLSHNDVNPTNLAYDGERLLLLDWDTAGLNDPFYDLASIAMFIRMDAPTCRSLLEAYDGKPSAEIPPRFAYDRRLVAVLCGVTFLSLAWQSGYDGATGDETPESTPSLGEIYQLLRTGSLNVATAAGQWSFGLALVKESTAE